MLFKGDNKHMIDAKDVPLSAWRLQSNLKNALTSSFPSSQRDARTMPELPFCNSTLDQQHFITNHGLNRGQLLTRSDSMHTMAQDVVSEAIMGCSGIAARN